MGGPVIERLRVFVEHDAREGKSADGAAAALREATVPELHEASRLLNDSYATRALEDPEREQLLTAYHGQMKTLIARGKTGVRALSGERLQRYERATLTRDTKALFPGALPELGALQARVSHVVSIARSNEAARGSPELSEAAFAPALRHFLGLNSGPDQIAEAHAHRDGHNVYVNLFDRAGFHVMAMQAQAAGRALHVVELKATHGRNVEDLQVYRLQDKIPGRGNARLVAEGLEQVVEIALANGFSSLSCVPASDEVAKLYAKMGFVADHGLELGAFNAMTLELADTYAVQQMVTVFGASRAGIHDVPKNVSEKMQAQGQALAPPNRTFGKFNFQGVPRLAVRLE